VATLGRDTLSGLSLVAWTTTPWTLLSNTGVAVGPELEYAVVGRRPAGGDIVAADLVEAVFGQ
jgi:isoleucyl-tRNA synthetase